MIIHNGDHLEFEIEHANTKPEDRPDWPLPSFDARDWAAAFCKLNPSMDEGLMISWFANALMRGYDEANNKGMDADGSIELACSKCGSQDELVMICPECLR